MKDEICLSRRNFVKSAVVLGGIIAHEMLRPIPASARCGPTPPETEGPFYPMSYPLDKDNDLTFVSDRSVTAQGQVIHIRGMIQDQACRPVAGARVEIWQACATGKYNHPGDRNRAQLDPHFQYWGKAVTNEKGEYGFKTIKPGSYPVSWFWTRPPHIHFKVFSRSHQDLTTQMYFAGEPLNDKDRLLQEHPREEQLKCIVPFRQTEREMAGLFNLTLKSS